MSPFWSEYLLKGRESYSHVIEKKNENIQMLDHDMIQTCRRRKRGWGGLKLGRRQAVS